MIKKFAIGVSSALIVLGFLNFFVPIFKVPIPHSLLHIVVGALGIMLSVKGIYLSFIKWLGIVSVILAALGFMGIDNIFNVLKLGIFNYWFYLVIGLLSIWVYISEKQQLKGN